MKSALLGELLVKSNGERLGAGRLLPLLSMTMRDGLVDQSSKFKKVVANRDLTAYKVVRQGQLVVGFPIDEAVLAIQRIHPAGIVSPAYDVWDVRAELVDPDYLERYLKSPRAISYYVAKLRGSTARRRSLPKSDFDGMPVPLPPLSEQRRIASIFDLVARTQEFEAIAARARSDVVTSAVANVLRSEEPTYVELAALCTRITDGTHQSPTFTSSGVPFLFISNIIGGSVRYETAKFVSQETFEELTRVVRAEPGDILYSAVGSYGVPARVEIDRPVVFQRHIAHIKPDLRKVNSVYLREVMASPVVRRQADLVARGGAQKTVTLGDLAKFKIPLVSESAQASIEDLARTSAAVSALAERRRALLVELQAALSGRLFNPTPTRAEGEL